MEVAVKGTSSVTSNYTGISENPVLPSFRVWDGVEFLLEVCIPLLDTFGICVFAMLQVVKPLHCEHNATFFPKKTNADKMKPLN